MTNISKAVNRLVVVCMLSVMIFLGIICNGAMQANAACGNWTTYKTGSPYCVDKGCGLFWLSDTEYQKHIVSKYARHPVEPLILIMMYKRIGWDAVNRAAIMHI